MSDVADPVETTEAPAPAAAATAPAAPAPAAKTTVEPTVKTAEAPAPAPEAKEDVSAWRGRALSQIFGEPKDDEPPETRTEREKLAKLAERFATPGDMLKSLREARLKIDAGLKPLALSKDATPEQIAEYRKAAGIPDKPEDYDLGLPKGKVLDDTDKALVDAWVAKVHGVNAPPDVVKAGVATLMEIREKQVAQIAQQDTSHKNEVEEALRAEWGNQDYLKNRDGIISMLNHADKTVAETIMNARGPDGRAIANNPAVLKWLTAHARELGYVGATVVPQGGDLAASVTNELEVLKKEMAADIEKWQKDPKKAARFMELTEQSMRLNATKK